MIFVEMQFLPVYLYDFVKNQLVTENPITAHGTRHFIAEFKHYQPDCNLYHYNPQQYTVDCGNASELYYCLTN